MWVKGEIFRNLDAAGESALGRLDRTSQPSPFDRLDWFHRIAEHCPPPGNPLIVRTRSEGAEAWLFLAERHGRAVGFASWYTLAFRAIFTGNPGEKTQRALIVAMARRLRRKLVSVALDHVPAEDAARIKAGFERAGWIGFVLPQTANWTIEVAGKSFADYWAERPGQLRSTAKRKAAKVAIATEILDRFDEAAWAAYEEIYAASWKPKEGSLPFLRAMAEAEGDAGTLRIGIARIDDVPVAAQLWTVEHGTAIIHKLAHREDAADMSPGTILSKALFAHVIDEDRVATIDFGTGDDRYKADWMTDRANRMRVELYNPRRPAGVVGAARAALSSLVARMRSR